MRISVPMVAAMADGAKCKRRYPAMTLLLNGDDRTGDKSVELVNYLLTKKSRLRYLMG